MDAKDNRWKMVHSIKKHMMIIQNVINFRFMNYSPFVSADSCLIRSFFVVVITRTSCSLVKSTAGVIYPDRVRLLESTFTSLTYPTKVPEGTGH